jgi:uncharacterized delta-60 repeat protein
VRYPQILGIGTANPPIRLTQEQSFYAAGTVTGKLIPPPAGPDTAFGLIRYNTNGSIETSFGKNGGVMTSFAKTALFATPFALALQSNGDLIAAGLVGQLSGCCSPGPSSFALTRYTSGGKLDTTFGSGGTVITPSEPTRPELSQ